MTFEDGNWQILRFRFEDYCIKKFRRIIAIKDCWNYLIFWKYFPYYFDKPTFKTCEGSDYNDLSLVQMLWRYCDCVSC